MNLKNNKKQGTIKHVNSVICLDAEQDATNQLWNINGYLDHLVINYPQKMDLKNGNVDLDLDYKIIGFWVCDNMRAERSIKKVIFYYDFLSPDDKLIFRTPETEVKILKRTRRFNGGVSFGNLMVTNRPGRYKYRVYAKTDLEQEFKEYAEIPLDISFRVTREERERRMARSNKK